MKPRTTDELKNLIRTVKDLNSIDTSLITGMSCMFQNAKFFNQPLNNWDVSNVKNMEDMFGGYFKSDKGFLNADINGAINILRRFVKDNDFVKRLINSKHIFNPKRLKPAEICCKQQYCALGFG